jgi:uncharacterized protein YkwD
MKRLAVVLFACALALGLVAPAAHVRAAYSPDDQEQQIVGLINDYRSSLGLGSVSLATDLGEAAQHHSEDMATNNYFSHTLSDGSSPEQNIHDFGYSGNTWGENIAAGMSSASDALQTWKNSPEHDAILRDPDFSLVGIGRAYNADTQYGWYWTADFGGPEGSAPATTTDAPSTDASNTTSPATTTTDVNGVKTQTVDGVSTHKQQAPSDGGNSTANAEPSPIVMGNLDLRGTTTTIVVPPSSSTGDASGDNNVNSTPPPPPAAPATNGGNTGQAGLATASGSDGSITYNASDNGNGNQVITSDNGSGNASGDGSGNGGGGNGGGTGGTGGKGDAAPQNPNQQVATCSDFASWYDAQNAYEAAGGTSADPALVNSLDPDWDGIACEEMMNS